MTDDQDANLQYLQVELARIDLLIRRSIRCWELAGQNPNDQFRGLHVTGSEAASLAERGLGRAWGDEVALPDAEEAAFDRARDILLKQAEKLRFEARRDQIHLRLVDLAQKFQLDRFEVDIFLICLAPSLDTRYERLYGFLQDDVTRKAPAVSLALELLAPAGAQRLKYLNYFHEDSTLVSCGLIVPPRTDAPAPQSLMRREWTVAPEVVTWLLGDYRISEELAPFIHLEEQIVPPAVSAFPQLDQTDWTAIHAKSPLMAFYGPDEILRLSAARKIAAATNRLLLVVDLAGLKAAGILAPSLLRWALRDAFLNNAIPCLVGWEIVLDEERVPPLLWMIELLSFPDALVVSSAVQWRAVSLPEGMEKPIMWWSFDLPNTAQRLEIWRGCLGTEPGGVTEAELVMVAGQFVLTTLQIQDAVRSARNVAFQQSRQMTGADLFEAARTHSGHHLDLLATKIHPRFKWEDIVLPEDEMSILGEIVATVRGRALVLETWGLGKKLVASAGISALFAGPPGTGKTLAAQVIASELGMDLYKIDLSTIVSKYIGETEKNLERIFNEARNSNTILFFDEADAIFGKRSEVKDAHDRYANIEVGYLLQRMESYDGVVILATNLRANMDEAFTRRLQFAVDFPFPDEAQRLDIWKVLFPPDLPREEDVQFEILAKRFKLSGGSIRNIIVSAAFLAASNGGKVGTRHLMHGVRREMQKMGRLIDEKELAFG